MMTEEETVAIYETGPGKLDDAARLDLAVRYIFQLRAENATLRGQVAAFVALSDRIHAAAERVKKSGILPKYRTDTRI
jgi:hypothetical protein